MYTVYTEKELSSMSGICEMLLAAENKTELKKNKKNLISYMRLLSNLHPHLLVPKIEFQITAVQKSVRCTEFPATITYSISYEVL